MRRKLGDVGAPDATVIEFPTRFAHSNSLIFSGHRMTNKVRVRFAPSPTGEPHIGNIRTAIFDWLFARRNGGDFLIRVEDTDQARKVEGATDAMLESLRWLGLDWDEGPDIGGSNSPYYQSQRLDRYRHIADSLVVNGWAYHCFCSTNRLATLRKEQQRQDEGNTGYDRLCRSLSEAEVEARIALRETPVVRFRMPDEGTTGIEDLIHGTVTFENRLYDDFVMLKSDGYPTYHLASVVDDHEMEITHVTRGIDWLSSIPLHIQLYRALNWRPPTFVHLPLILAPDRTKLSKRHGATSVAEFREIGILPETMLNFLTLLGWSLDDKTEIFSRDELIQRFSFERVSLSDAVWDEDKLRWMNGVHIRESRSERFSEALDDFWQRYPPQEFTESPDTGFAIKAGGLIQNRIKTLAEAAPMLPFFFKDADYTTEELVQKGMDPLGTRVALSAVAEGLMALTKFETESIEGLIRPLAASLNLKVGQLLGTLRVATTGLKVSPPIFETMEALGRDRTLNAIQSAIERLRHDLVSASLVKPETSTRTTNHQIKGTDDDAKV